MNIEDIIHELSHLRELDLTEDQDDAIVAAIDELEKHVPKKPHWIYNSDGELRCEHCGTIVEQSQECCPNCKSAMSHYIRLEL